MKHKLLYTLGFIVLGWAVLGGTPAEAVTAAGPYYAPPAWSQQLQCDTQATCPRFIVLSNWGNAAVLDRETGLVWEQSPNPFLFSWANAQRHCNITTVGNRKGWRLPTLQELASLVDPTQSNPALPSGHPFIIGQPYQVDYWSATSNANFTTDVWTVVFSNGNVNLAPKSANLHVWCVRGGSGVDIQ